MGNITEVARRRQLPTPEVARDIRVRSGIQSNEMAAEIGVHPVTFSRWERGAMKPTGIHVERWARLLHDLAAVLGDQQ